MLVHNFFLPILILLQLAFLLPLVLLLVLAIKAVDLDLHPDPIEEKKDDL